MSYARVSEASGVVRSSYFSQRVFIAGFNTGPTYPGDFDPTFQEEVHDVGAHKSL